MYLQLGPTVGCQRFDHHFRTQVGAADANMDYIGDGLASVAKPFLRTYRIAEIAHLCQYTVDARHHIRSIHEDGTIGTIAQRDVQHGTFFR